MSGIKRTDGTPGFVPVTTTEVAPTAPVQEAKPQTPLAPADQMSADAPKATLVADGLPPGSTSTGLKLVGDLRDDANFGDAPNARPALGLINPDFQFDTALLSMDMGAYFNDAISAGHPNGDQMKALMQALGPGGLDPIDPALVI